MGQTKRLLKTRLQEHKNDIKKVSSQSVITRHRLELNHDFNWEQTKILDEECSYYKRLTSEMVHIGRQSNGLNKQSDTELLSDIYIPILNLLPTL